MLLSLMSSTVTPDSSRSLGEEVFPVIVGAIVALAGSVFVQLWLIPRVDTRKRREQRWEEDVLALGQLLTFEHPSLVNGWRAGLHGLGRVAQAAGELDGDEWSAAHLQQHEKLRSAHQVFQALRVRIDWLSDRVMSLAPRSPALQDFGELSRRYSVQYAQLIRLEWEPEVDGRGAPTREEVNAAGEALDEVTHEIVTALKALLAGAPPRDPAIRKRAARDGGQVSDRASFAERVKTWWRDLRAPRSGLDDVSE